MIFREFHQVGNPERDRTKGLGLGLAIVQRVAALLAIAGDAAVGARPRQRLPGCGAAASRRTGRRRPRPLRTAVPAARTGTIFVIDDELAVRQAMVSLLSTWGHRVVVAESAEALLAIDMARDVRPDLIISDYRLRDGANGIAAIRAVQARHGDDIPGVLITGDTAPDRIAEAEASGFLLLHKPLSNARLRAAIGNLCCAGASPRTAAVSMRAASPRLATFSVRKIAVRCAFTVFSEIVSRCAISLFEASPATSFRMSRWRSVSTARRSGPEADGMLVPAMNVGT